MKFLKSVRTIQGKFTLYLSILIIVGVSIILFLNISREMKLLREAIIREGKALVESLAISCTNTTLYEEIGLIEEGGLLDNYISDLMQRKDLKVLYAMIIDPDGKVIAHNSMIELGNTYHDELTKRVLTSSNTLIQYHSENILDIFTPLSISTKRWGDPKSWNISGSFEKRGIIPRKKIYSFYCHLYCVFYYFYCIPL